MSYLDDVNRRLDEERAHWQKMKAQEKEKALAKEREKRAKENAKPHIFF